MAYATNLPYMGQPRGLGELGHQAAGFGTWVIDMHWGLSPKNIRGQNRPYGPGIVQTHYPRSQDPRLLNLSMGPVVPGGSWPNLRPMTNMPVFRTPMRRPGVKQESLPPLGLSGMGYLPVGIATPPYEMLGPMHKSTPGAEQPYEQMPGMLSGFGQSPDDEVVVNAAGQSVGLSRSDLEYIRDNPSEVRNTLFALLQSLVTAQNMDDRYNELYATLLAANEPSPSETATQVVFGSAQARSTNAQMIQSLMQVRTLLAGSVTEAEIAQWPEDMKKAWSAFMDDGSSGYNGYGMFGQAEGAVTVVLAGAAGTGAQAASTAGTWLATTIGGSAMVWGFALMVLVIVIVILIVAAIVYAAWPANWSGMSGAAGQINGAVASADAQSADDYRIFQRAKIEYWTTAYNSATDPDTKQRAYEQMQFWSGQAVKGAEAEKDRGNKKDAAGGGNVWKYQLLALGVLGVMTMLFLKRPGAARAYATGGGAHTPLGRDMPHVGRTPQRSPGVIAGMFSKLAELGSRGT